MTDSERGSRRKDGKDCGSGEAVDPAAHGTRLTAGKLTCSTLPISGFDIFEPRDDVHGVLQHHTGIRAFKVRQHFAELDRLSL